MKGYTTIEQSKKLAEFGLNPETADMCYFIDYKESNKFGINKYSVQIDTYGFLVHEPDNIPCWSLAALLELMPNIKTEHGIIRPKSVKENSKQFAYRYYYETLYYTDMCRTPIEAAYNMTVWLLENGYIKKGE